MEFQKLNLLNFFCVFSIDSKVSLEKNIPPGTMIAEKSFMKKGRKLAGVSRQRTLSFLIVLVKELNYEVGGGGSMQAITDKIRD